MRFKMMAVLEVACVLFVVGSVWGQTPTIFEDRHLFASDGTLSDTFGNSISISGSVAIVGASQDDTAGGVDAGSAYVYRYDGVNWVEEAHLIASDGALGDRFGKSVALSGNLAIVGASKDNTTVGMNTGSAYVFRFNGTNWVEEALLFASDGATGDQFGLSVSVSGSPGNEVAIMGAPSAGVFSNGSAYIFRFNGISWVQESHLSPPSIPKGGGNFGVSVSVSGMPGNEVAIVGASQGNTAAGISTGTAYVYRFTGATWTQQPQIFASDGAQGDKFGISISINGDVVIVGALFDDTTVGMNTGSAYVFRFNGTNWVEEALLFASDGAASDNFGFSVSISGAPGSEVAIVGASQDDTAGGVDAGSAYVYRYDGVNWVEEAHLFAFDGAASDLFGRSVSTDGIIYMVGAMWDDNAAGVNAGLAYVFNLDCNSNGVGDIVDLAMGTSLDCNSNWVPDECEPVENDCNTNNVPDECDITSGFSIDLNSNGIPDECEPDCNINGIPDFIDIEFGVSIDCDLNGIPDECEPDCNGNGIADACDISTGVSMDIDGNGVPDECDPDCNSNGLPDGLDIFTGTSNDFNGNGVPDECDPDCNNNGLPDFLDIQFGTSQDINLNGVPDECEVDCNANGIWDSIDIEAGTSNDINGNLIPDECETDCNGNGVPDDWDIAIGSSVDFNNDGIPDECKPDCNGNGIPDFLDILFGASQDQNSNGIPDECECPGDITPPGGNGTVNIDDLVAVLNAFGPCPTPPASCDTDITPLGGNGVVNIDDLVAVLNGFGVCP